MPDAYSLSPRKAHICRIAGVVFLLLAALTTSGVVVAAVVPETLAAASDLGLEIESPLSVLSKDAQTQVAASPAAQHRFDVYLRKPLVRLGMVGIVALDTLPFAVLLLSVGLALRQLGRGGDPLARALPWLRRASIAAIVAALATPFHDSLQAMLLYPGTPVGGYWALVVDLGSIGSALMLAVAAYAAVWALEAGLDAQRELAEIV